MIRFLNKTYFALIVLSIVNQNVGNSQIYTDHFGAGNQVGVTVTSSDSLNTNVSQYSLAGTGYFPDLVGASRFLAQASLGASYSEMQYITQVGIDDWIEEQIALPYVPYLSKSALILDEINSRIQEVHPGEEMDRPGEVTAITFYKSLIDDADVLRNKIAYSLLQILVVSRASIVLSNQLEGHMSYYDILYGGAFSNYRELLEQVTLHPIMGYYLSHLQNKKGNPSIGTLPDENYAREIMQLFTIGLFELNIDGTYKLDDSGNRIPTYTITDVQELAKVFTGLSGGAWNLDEYPEFEGNPINFNSPLRHFDPKTPMLMYEEYHEQGEKKLFDGTVIPAGQSGMEDIDQALDVIFGHPNVGPFIARRLIQQMVKSNPTPAYIRRVALAFNNNGKGVRGDMKAVIRAILLDNEARDCSWLADAKNGKLRQPIERLVQLFKAFDIQSPSGRIWFTDRSQIEEQLGQAFMAAPSVFNFFTPFYAEGEYVEPNDMVSPEFQILHAVTSINYLNYAENAVKDRPFRNRTRVNNNNPRLSFNNQDDPTLNFNEEITQYQANGLDGLLERLNLLLCHGQLSDNTASIIIEALQQMEGQGGFSEADLVENAIYFVLASPDYIILE